VKIRGPIRYEYGALKKVTPECQEQGSVLALIQQEDSHRRTHNRHNRMASDNRSSTAQARHQLPFPFSNQDDSTPPPLLLTQGAEALVYRTTFLTSSTACALKYRPAKPWRHRTLDLRLTRQRILAEARVLTRCRREGVTVPAVLGLDWERGWLAQEWIYGNTVRRVLDWVHRESGLSNSEKEHQVHNLLQRIGSALGRLHERGLVHGDLTTSNLMIRPAESDMIEEDKQVGKAVRIANTNGEVVLIDFGLAQQTVQEEDKAVDLYVLERAFASTHPEVEQDFGHLLQAYGESHKGAKTVLKRLEDVRMRGRKKSMLG
jgi:TP53 regulating kinase-like protein